MFEEDRGGGGACENPYVPYDTRYNDLGHIHIMDTLDNAKALPLYIIVGL